MLIGHRQTTGAGAEAGCYESRPRVGRNEFKHRDEATKAGRHEPKPTATRRFRLVAHRAVAVSDVRAKVQTAA